MKTKELISQIISLPVEDRAFVVDTVLKSMNPTDAETEKKWIAAAKRRASELRSGNVKAIPGDEVFSKIWNRLSI